MATHFKTWSIALLVGLAVGLVGDFAVLNYNSITTTHCDEIAPNDIVLPKDHESPSVGEDVETEYIFDDVPLESMSVSIPAGEKSPKKRWTITVSAMDEGSSVYYEIGQFSVKGAGTAYAKLHLTGAAKQIEVTCDDAKATGIETRFNVAIPYVPHLMFIVGCTGIALMICLFRPRSLIYRKRFDESKRFIAILTAIIVGVSCISTGYMSNKYPLGAQEHQYYELAEAFAEGHAYLNDGPSEELLALDNPYDYHARTVLKKTNPEGINWDHALYEGKYYVYFGVLPCLVFFLPYYLVTGGAEFPMFIAVMLTMAILCLGMMRLSFSCCRRWSPACSQATLLYSAITFATGSWIVYAAIKPGHYALPILLGLALLVWGLDLCLEATAGKRISVPHAAAGAGLIAATIACRPQLLLGGLVALAFLTAHMRRYGARNDIKALAIAILPIIVVFALQGWYNYIRFGSFFDFGANYNLTTNDMTKRGFNVDRTPLALLAYLIQPPNIGASSPFLRPVDLNADYFGVSITEHMFGGIFCLTPLLLPIFLPVLRRYRQVLGKERLALISLSALCAIALVVFDANGAGILPRYFMDFGVFLAFGSVMCIIGLWGNRERSASGPAGDKTDAHASDVPDDIALSEHYLYFDAGKPHLSLAGLALLSCAFVTGVIMMLNAARIGM